MKKIKLFLAAFAAMVGLSAQAWDGSAGKVYLQNVGSGLYWGAGDHLNWGTRAMLVENPEYVTLSLAEGVYKLESQVSNGGTAYYFNGDYMDNGSPVSLTITQSGDYWTIANGTTYYGYNGSTSKAIQDNTSGLTADSEGAKWIIRTHDEMLADLANGTVANPKDATFLFLDPGFGRNNRNVGSWTVSDDCTNKNLNGANPNNYGCGESYHSTFTISQTAEVPNGVYKVSGRAFYRQDGTDNTHIPYLEANGQTSPFPLMNTGINSMKGAQESFIAGNWTIDPMIVEVTTRSLEIKMVCEQKNLWCILDGLELAYYGPITLADLPLDEAYVNSYNTALNAAQAYQSQDMFDADKTVLNTVISENEFDASTKKQGELAEVQTAIANLNAAAAAASVAVDQYTRYNTAVSTINGGTNVDLTSIIGNPDFEVNPVQYQLVDGGWTNEGVGIQYQNNTGFDGYKSNTWFAERWVASGQIGAFKTSQTLTLPAGIYELSVVGTFNGNGASLFVGNATTSITDATTYKLLFKASDKEQVTFGVQAISPTGTWFKADNFQLTYVGEDFPAYTLASGKMSNTAATAQSNAETTFNNDKTVANYNALLTAITAAQASVTAYATAATAIDDANALKEAHNFATAAATTTFAEDIAAVQTKYNEGTLTDAEAAAGGNLGTVVTGWHGGATTAASNYLENGFGLNDFGTNLYVNTWSNEGATDGSNFKVPFYEYWNEDTKTLAENKWSGTLAVENGLYSVSALVRVRAKNEVAAADANGITMDINGGGEGDYAAVDVTAGEQIGSSQFQIATYTAQGLVKDGTLTLNFNVAADNNISWLSFKNVKYTKVRDLTPEEAAVVPADLAIDATSTIYKGKTTTLAATSTTEGASIDGFVNWTSDNTSIATVDANGVVTGVAYGTANITATSTLNAEATATCAVTVTAPTYDQLENLDFAEGPVIDNHICTYSADMTKPENNTTFCHVQEVAGWSIASTDVDGKAAGVMAYGSSTGMGNNSIFAPATNPAAEATGNVLGMVGVWTNSVQYVQNVKFLAGAYTITIPVYRNGGATALTKNLIGVILDDGTEHLATTTTYAQDKWTTETIKFTVAEETYGRLSLGLNAPNKGSADSQRLWIDGVTVTFEPFATAEEIAALNAAIETAEGKTLGFDEGDFAPYTNVAGVTALAAAKALDTTNPIAQSDVTNATTALTSATWTANTEELNAVYDGTFAAAENNGAPAGWTMSNNTLGGATHSRAFVGDTRLSEFNTTNSALFIRFDGTYSDRGSLYYYGNKTGYTMPLKAGVTYYAKADIKGWGSTGKNQRMNISGPTGFSTVSQDLNLSNNADTDDAEPQQFLIVFTASVDGNYVINFQTPGDDSQKHNAVISNVEVKKATPATMKISDAQYATFVAPFAVEIPSGVTAYTVDGVTGTTLDMTELTTTIPANTPVVLYKESALDATTFYGKTVAGTPTEGLLTGVYTSTVVPVGSYVLQKNNEKVAFYLVEEGEQPTANANRAYLSAPTAGVKAAAYYFGTATAIRSLFNGLQNGDVYDLAGRKVQKMQKGGVYIVNGQKVVVK